MKRLLFLLLIVFFVVGCDANATSTTATNENVTDATGILTVHYIDVGQGNATLIHLNDGEETYAILYDVGDWQGDEVVPYLEQQQIDALDVVIVSHPHADHIGQLNRVIERFDVGEVWMSGNETNTQVFESSIEAVLESDADYAEPRAKEQYDIGPLTLTILHPETLTGDLNEDSLSFRLTFGEIAFLFTGDATKNEELEMMERTQQLTAQILLLGHHGSDTSSDPTFIQAVNPEVAVYSAGEGNSYGHPHEKVIHTLLAEDVDVYGTDINGTIILETDGSTYQVTTEKEEEMNLTNDQDIASRENDVTNGSENCIDLNKASKTELMEIIHIGEARAEQIIELRPFEKVNELIEINGIGESNLSEIKDQALACVGDE